LHAVTVHQQAFGHYNYSPCGSIRRQIVGFCTGQASVRRDLVFSCGTWTMALCSTNRAAKAGRENGKHANAPFLHSHRNILKSSAATTI